MTEAIKEDLREQLERHARWSKMTPAQKKKQLFLDQKELLDKFLARHAISQAQYDKSLIHLREKMGFAGV